MKVKFTWEAGEEKAVSADLNAILARHPGAKVKHTDKFPFYHAYITIPRPKH